MTYTVQEISEMLRWTDRQIYDRLRQLAPLTDAYCSKGKRGALLLQDGALAILRKLYDLETDGLSITDAISRIRKDFDSSHLQPQPHYAQDDATTVVQRVYEDQIALLKELLGQKDEQIARLHDIMSRQLPSSSESRKSRWQHLKSLITGK